ncbi:FAD-binding oxidoreductase [Collinsella tanakaei]|uniref:FAD-binding oxidoreductase n=1 Tax=Collinsella tanakaei TaxID=626935 RepID=UPI00195BA9D2|nr:FAD-binding oxidoreductase [Collinsella tanakaei]MBM6779591.1 FAD-binding oxidoreductase [Collinsella tanakaei]
MVDMLPMTPEFGEYLRDESRSVGTADSISFPRTEDEIRSVLRSLHGVSGADGKPVAITVQGARTGLAAGAVPSGGHVMNLSRATAYLGLSRDEDGTYLLRVQPGVILSELRRHLARHTVPTDGWDRASLDALEELYAGPEQFFPTDPTETSACVGGMAACNASGARSYAYGPMRPHVRALRVALADGDVVALRRGEVRARARRLTLATESGRTLELDLPTYTMPCTKNASGYFVEDDMDAIDLFIGSDGTLGIICELELALMPTPAVSWGVNCFFASESDAIDFTCAVRPVLSDACAIEYFDADALNILRRQRERSTAFSALPAMDDAWSCCVYVELACSSREQALAELARLGDIARDCGGSNAATWVGRTDIDRETQRFFRHAVPESVNMLIDERRRTDPTITKLGSDMSVPDERLRDVMALYRADLAAAGLESAAWGHIGNNHLHVNVLPRNTADYAAGKRLFEKWARAVTDMGGAVSAEHGVGKLKRSFLAVMYGEQHICEMASLKRQLDPYLQLGQGNLFELETCERGA